MKHLDLFSGIGGFALACDWAGIETVGFVEIDKFCQKVLKKHWPDVSIIKDVNDVEEIKNLVNVAYSQSGSNRKHTPELEGGSNDSGCVERDSTDATNNDNKGQQDGLQSENIIQRDSLLLTAGFPCQPFSNAGRKRGASDSRYLWPQTLAVIKAVQPDWIILENVAGLLNMVFPDSETRVASQASFCEVPNDEIADYDTISGGIDRDLTEAGYETVWLVIPACSLGAPHRRDRVWIVSQRISKNTNSQRGSRGSENSRQVLGCGSTEDKTERSDSEGGIVAHTIGAGARSNNREITNERWGASQDRREGIRQENGQTSSGGVDSADKHGTTPNPSNDGCNRNDQGSSNEGQQPNNQVESGHRRTGRAKGCGGDASDALGVGLGRCSLNESEELREPNGGISAPRGNPWSENWYEVAQRFCQLDARVSDNLAGRPGRDKYRVQKLKALGNAIVPAVAYELIKAIKETAI